MFLRSLNVFRISGNYLKVENSTSQRTKTDQSCNGVEESHVVVQCFGRLGLPGTLLKGWVGGKSVGHQGFKSKWMWALLGFLPN